MTRLEKHVIGFLCAVLAMSWLLVWSTATYATTYTKQEQDQRQKQVQKQDQKQMQSVETISTSTATSAAMSDSFSEGGAVTINSRGGNDTVFVPNNNSEGCLRVFGIAIPGRDGSAVLGIPWRSQACDLEASADDAFAQGNLALGWMLKCKMKALQKAFGNEETCLRETVGTLKVMAEVERLRTSVEILQQERKIDRAKCNESKDRIFETCYEDK